MREDKIREYKKNMIYENEMKVKKVKKGMNIKNLIVRNNKNTVIMAST